ncbi:unnamed protein product [Moneuplotes crassus]|uniref:BZIP domain-containing protein n=1 Tax=Euplotes crassus TaxID=5936 RepID=A0AAD2CYJ2_EUPCR|nr:unnamed protein product [Moneuplotes crassus]
MEELKQPIIPDSFNQPKTNRKTMKERSKEHRERKKAYISNLETKIVDLETQVRDLTTENEHMKAQLEKSSSECKTQVVEKKSGAAKSSDTSKNKIEKSFKSSLHEYEDFVYDKLNKKMLENPDEVRYTTLEQAYEHIEDYSDDRFIYIDRQFRNIINNIVGIETKIYQACLKNLKLSEIKRRMKTKKRHSKYFVKKEFRLDQIMFDEEWSKPLMEVMEKYGEELQNFGKTIKSLVKKLVQVRNKLFNTYISMAEIDEKIYDTADYHKQDVKGLFEIYNLIKDTKYMTPHYLWDIPKRPDSELAYKDFELSSSEDDE